MVMTKHQRSKDRATDNMIRLSRQHNLELLKAKKKLDSDAILDLVGAGLATLRIKIRDDKGRVMDRAKWAQIVTMTEAGRELLERA